MNEPFKVMEPHGTTEAIRYADLLQQRYGGEWSVEIQPYVEPLTGAKRASAGYRGSGRFGP